MNLSMNVYVNIKMHMVFCMYVCDSVICHASLLTLRNQTLVAIHRGLKGGRVEGGFAAMSAVVCGKRNFFEEVHPPVPKRLRCVGGFDLCQTESLLGSIESPQNLADFLSQLKIRFPHMDDQVFSSFIYS
jgi:hypothetical protein